MRIKLLITSAAAIFLAGCSLPDVTYENGYLKGTPPVETSNADDVATACFRDKLALVTDTFTVTPIMDEVGKSNFENVGKFVTQSGAGHMAMSTLFSVLPKGLLIESLNREPQLHQIKMTASKLLSDGKTYKINTGKKDASGRPIYKTQTYRPNVLGTYKAAKYYVTGAITEFNVATSSAGAEVGIMGIGPRYREFNAHIAMNLRLVETSSGTVVAQAPFDKRITGIEAGVGITHIFGTTLVLADAGGIAKEPVDLVVRMLTKIAVQKMLIDHYKTGEECFLAPTQQPAAT